MNEFLNRGRLRHRGLCVILTILTLAGPVGAQEAKPAANAAALPYVLPRACVVIAIRPKQLLESEPAAAFPWEVLQAAMIRDFGVDPLQAEEVLLSVAPPIGGPPAYALYAKFTAPMQLKSGPLTAHTGEGTLAGKAYLKSGHPLMPSFFSPTDDSLLATPDDALRQFVGGTSPSTGAGPLLAQFSSAMNQDDFLAMVDVESLRPLIGLGLAQAAGKIPLEFRPLIQTPSLIRSVELRLNFTQNKMTSLHIAANDEASAKQVEAILNDVKDAVLAKAAASPELVRMRASADPVEQAMARYQERMQSQWKGALHLNREGDRFVLFNTKTNETNMLVAVAVIGVLVALLLPAVQAAREAARRNASLNNLKQIMLGLFDYETAKGAFPAYANFDDSGKPLLSWRVHLLPYMEQNTLYRKFRLDEPWDSPHNKALISQMPEIYNDPSSRLQVTDGKSSYLGVEGAGRFFDGSTKGRKIASIHDGASRTICVLQVDDEEAVVWTKPDDWEMNETKPLSGLGGLRPGAVFLAGFCDGHGQVLQATMDPDVFRALLTTAGGETLPAGW